MIQNFDNYTEFVIMVSASGFIASHYVPKNALQSGMIFYSSYYYNANSNAMASIGLNPDGGYQIAQGLAQNSQGSSVAVYGR